MQLYALLISGKIVQVAVRPTDLEIFIKKNELNVEQKYIYVLTNKVVSNLYVRRRGKINIFCVCSLFFLSEVPSIAI